MYMVFACLFWDRKLRAPSKHLFGKFGGKKTKTPRHHPWPNSWRMITVTFELGIPLDLTQLALQADHPDSSPPKKNPNKKPWVRAFLRHPLESSPTFFFHTDPVVFGEGVDRIVHIDTYMYYIYSTIFVLARPFGHFCSTHPVGKPVS